MGLQLPRRVRRAFAGLALVLPVLLLGACSQDQQDAWQRGAIPEGASDRSDAIITLWQWTWVAALATGVLVWGLIAYAVIKFRRRSDDEIPVQTRYNLPMEILYTVAPVVMVLVFFNFIIQAQDEVQAAPGEPDHTVKVVGQQWSWTFNYIEDEALDGSTTVYEAGTPADPPTLYLPVNESVNFELSSPDVIHSFWVPAFTYKMDVVPGRDNEFTMTPTREGTYAGKCAELCGTYHSRMLFDVKVVSAEEYAQQLSELEEQGNVGEALGGSDSVTQDGLDETGEGE
ncbi:cytochrome c oxidase subunit II [Nocardioides sp. HDW12B]|uniref:aa3-type cytochrome oxidase subunit II n=1 Tax=Nocardioides sp. HDW12B TaxID=2714939 RepID=UPI001F0E04BC|nr:cytochrome c oxidase subunit II [Nocardioides sp. HDW12B]